MSTPGIRVLNYRPAAAWVERLRASGYAVDVRPLRAPADLKAIGEDPPAAVAIDLSRAPSQGRDFGLEEGLERVAGAVTTDKLWIVWPKKTSSLASDVSQRDVRSAGLRQGLVDFKICAVDEDWSGLLFSRRKK